MITRISSGAATGVAGNQPLSPDSRQPRFQLANDTAPQGASPAPATPLTESLSRTVADIEKQRHDIDRFIRRAARGSSFSATDLLAMQAKVGSYSQQVDLLSKLVDKTLAAVKTTLNTQV